MIRLSQEFGAHAGRQLSFDQDRVRVGRAPDGDVSFDPNIDLDASGRHCELVREGGAWFVVDLGSRNGTFVNGQRVSGKHKLVPSDVVECGRGGPRLRVMFDAPAARTVAALPGPAATATAYGAPSVPIPRVAAPAPAAPVAAPLAAPAAPGPKSTVAVPAAELHGIVAQAAGAPVLGAAPTALPGHGTPGLLPTPGPSQAHAPGGGGIGKRTMNLMIDQALARQAKGHRGLQVAVVLLTLLVLGGLGAGGWYYWDREYNRDPEPARAEVVQQAAGNDPSNAGARIAAANEAAVYLLALVQPSNNVLRGFCTGFAVSADLVATNAHCVLRARDELRRGARLVLLRNKAPGVQIAATPAYADARFQSAQHSRGGSGYDVGLVRAAQPLPVVVRLASQAELEALHEGDGVFVYGFPGLTMNEGSPVATITLGLLNRLTDFFDRAATPPAAQKFLHSAQTAGGSSGSPIFSPRGYVVGLNAGSLADEETQIVTDPSNGQRRQVEVNRGSNFKYGMRADLVRQAALSLGQRLP
jgi:V8-like Glu-specific endopeptidase